MNCQKIEMPKKMSPTGKPLASKNNQKVNPKVNHNVDHMFFEIII